MNANILKWQTWVGENYKTLNNRLLVFAESAYDWPEDKNGIIEKNDFVKKLVNEHGLYFLSEHKIKNSPLFRNVERMIFRESNVPENKIEKFWQAIAFNEFIQRAMRDNKDRPSNVDFNKGRETFAEIIKNLDPKPTLIILLGIEAYRNIINIERSSYGYQIEDKTEWNELINKTYPRKGILKMNGLRNPISVIAVKHPSKYFSYDIWHDYFFNYFNSFINEIIGNKP